MKTINLINNFFVQTKISWKILSVFLCSSKKNLDHATCSSFSYFVRVYNLLLPNLGRRQDRIFRQQIFFCVERENKRKCVFQWLSMIEERFELRREEKRKSRAQFSFGFPESFLRFSLACLLSSFVLLFFIIYDSLLL